MTPRMIRYGLIALAVVATFLVGKTLWNNWHDRRQGEDIAVMKERLRVDSLIHVGDSIALANTRARLDEAVSQGIRVVEKWNTVKVPVYLPPTSTPHDTIQNVARRLSACYAAGDSLVASIVKLTTSCSAFRDTATKTIADQRKAYAHLDSLLKIGRKPRRFGIGPFLGYGYSNNGQDANLERRVSIGIAVSYHIISW